MSSGALIIDSNCFRRLEEPTIQESFRRILNAKNLEFWPTALNAFELAKTRTSAIRERLLRIISALCQGSLLLPTPPSILRRIALAGLRGERGFQTEASGLEWLLEDARDLTPEIIDQAQVLCRRIDASFEDLHAEMRSYLKENCNGKVIKEIWPSARDFLDSQWMHNEQLDTIIHGIWRNLELPGTAPIDFVLSMKAWRLYLEGLGAAIYRRAISSEQGKMVQLSDLSQLVYLAGRQRSLLITEDIGFLHTVRDVVDGRHRDVSVISWEDFIKNVP
jgi:hypothetical protein